MDVAGIGVPYFDQVLSIDKLPITDSHAHTLEASWQYGGKVPTALVAVARLGYKASIHANVGGIFGRCIRLDFERHGIDCSQLKDVPGTNSAVCICLAEKSTGGRSFLGIPHPAGVPALTVQDLNKKALLEAKWLLISDLDEASAQAARWFKEAGKPVVIDADYMNTVDNLELVDHFIASEYTYKALTDGSDRYEENLAKIRERQKNPRAVIVVTLGANGAAGIDNGGNYFRIPAYKVEVVDTTGAGDVFHGAYIAGCLEGMDTTSACRYASAASAVNCTKLGGRAAIPTREQLKIFMDTGQYDFPEFKERADYYRVPPFERVGL